MTKQDLLNSITAVVKNNPATPLRGDVLKAELFKIVEECYNNTNNASHSFPKDDTITTEHIGLLAMQKCVPNTANPQSPADFDVIATLCNTVPAVAGTKGQYKLSFSSIAIERPETKIIRVMLNENVNNNNVLRFYYLEQQGNNIIGDLIFKVSYSSSDGVVIGTTKEATIANIIEYFSTENNTLTNLVNVFDSDSNYIDFELLINDTDENKYTKDTAIDVANNNNSDDFANGVIFNFIDRYFIDSYGNKVDVILGTPIGLSYPVEKIGDCEIPSGRLRYSSGYFIIDTLFTVDSIYRTEDGTLQFISTGQDTVGTTSIFPAYYSAFNIFNITTQRELNITAAQVAQSISNNNNYLISANSWDSDGGSTLLSYATLFRNDNGQPNGTNGAFGLKYFATEEEQIDAINWALFNTKDNNNVCWFTSMFDIIEPLTYNQDTSQFEMVITNKTAPNGNGSTDFQTNNYNTIYTNYNTIVGAESGTPEHVPYSVLGRIAGVDGDNVLIDTSFMFNLQMCSEADGALGNIPYNSQLDLSYTPFVIAWRDGKVIDCNGILLMNGDSTIKFAMFSGSMFRLLGLAAPDATVTVDRGTIFIS